MSGVRVFQPKPLEEFVRRVVLAMGADEAVASEVARHLVRANLSGHDSHGVLRLPQYVGQAEAGQLVPSALPRILRETGVTALFDACRGFGQYSTAFAMDCALERARESGLAATAIRHSTHIGRLGEYTERAADRGLIAIVTAGLAGPGVGGMALYGSTKRFFGANPWSIGIPALDHPPMIMDGSTSTVAEGKVRLARAKGESLAPGCIADSDGRPSTNADDFYAGGALLPLGGEVAGHKGYGLALASALLGGLSMIDDPEPTMIGSVMRQEVEDPRGLVSGVFLVVINPACFGDEGHYRAEASATLAAIKRTPPAAGRAEVLVPGEPEARLREQREREGIALPEGHWTDLARVAERFGVELPEARPA